MLQPVWAPIHITLQDLCNGDLDRPLSVRILKLNRGGGHDVIGECSTSMRDLQARAKSTARLPLRNELNPVPIPFLKPSLKPQDPRVRIHVVGDLDSKQPPTLGTSHHEGHVAVRGFSLKHPGAFRHTARPLAHAPALYSHPEENTNKNHIRKPKSFIHIRLWITVENPKQ